MEQEGVDGFEQRVRSWHQRRQAMWALWVLVVVLVIVLWLKPQYAMVNGETMRLTRGMTVAGCARVVGLSLGPGDLIDVRGNVLMAGAGHGAVVLRNGRCCHPTDRVHNGDKIVIHPPCDVVEPIEEVATKLRSTPRRADGRPVNYPGRIPVYGLHRVSRGEISTLIRQVELTSAVPVVKWKDPDGPPTVALTFDDGPNGVYTPKILDILKQHNVRATFFVLGSLASRRPDVIRRIIAEGHEVGIHTWNHGNLTKLSPAAIRADIGRCSKLLTALIEGGPPLRWVRPPYGAINSGVRGTLKEMGYGVAMWTIDTGDWRRPGVDTIYRRAISRARDGSVVLMHDGGGPRSQTVAALARIVPELQKRGYLLVTMSQQAELQPIFEGEVIIQAPERVLRVRPVAAGLKVIVDGKEVELPQTPVTVDGQILLPVRPLLKLLGASFTYDAESQTLHLITVRGSLLLRLNSRSAELNHREIQLQLPPILYRSTAMVPMWLMANSCRARMRYDERNRVLEFTSYMQLNLSAPGAPQEALGIWEYRVVSGWPEAFDAGGSRW